jgi:hypothetical protein
LCERDTPKHIPPAIAGMAVRAAGSTAASVATFGALLVVILLIFGTVFETRPFEGDNLYILQWSEFAAASDLPRADPDVYPEWRPLAYATIWLQYQWAGIDHLWTYYLLNVLLWTASGWLVYRIVLQLTGSGGSGLVAAGFVLTSQKLISSFVLIVDRQSSLACLFGLSAWLLVIIVKHRRMTRAERIVVASLLLASALSKEYGLAFAVATALCGLLDSRRDLTMAAAFALASYVGLRFGFASGALATYCEDHGFFFVQRTVCFDGLNAMAGTQAVYNVVATGFETLLPGLLTTDGVIAINPRRVLISLVFVSLAALGWARGPKTLRLSLFVVIVNVLESFLLFRSRNQVVAVCAIGVAVGCGLSIASSALRQANVSRRVMTLAIACLFGLLFARAHVVRSLVATRVDDSSVPNACAPGVPNPDRAFMLRVWQQYGMPLPLCPETSAP